MSGSPMRQIDFYDNVLGGDVGAYVTPSLRLVHSTESDRAESRATLTRSVSWRSVNIPGYQFLPLLEES